MEIYAKSIVVQWINSQLKRKLLLVKSYENFTDLNDFSLLLPYKTECGNTF